MGDGAASDFFATISRLTVESMKEKILLQDDLNKTLGVLGCILSYSTDASEIQISVLTGISKEKVEEVFNKARGAYLKKGTRI